MRYLDKFFDKASNANWLNKYTLSIVAFIVWISFFDKYNLITQSKLSTAIEELEERKENYEVQLKEALVERENIENNIEKYAREHYRMHKDDEEVIVLKKGTTKK